MASSQGKNIDGKQCPNKGEVISLVDEEDKIFRETLKRSLIDQGNSNTYKKSRQTSATDNIISLLDSDDDIDHGDENPFSLSRKNDDDEIEILDASIAKPAFEQFSTNNETCSPSYQLAAKSQQCQPLTTGDRKKDDDDEVLALGRSNALNLPHMRQHCLEHKFLQDLKSVSQRKDFGYKSIVNEGNRLNPKFCELCYCYVCDKPASMCTFWTSKGNKSPHNHCLASDKGNDELYWKRLRAEIKGKSIDNLSHSSSFSSLNSDESSTPGANPAQSLFFRFRDMINRPISFSDISRIMDGNEISPTTNRPPGPFKPDDPIVNTDKTLTKCRKCGWFTRFFHKNFTECKTVYRTNSRGRTVPKRETLFNPIGEKDWCHACGRVCSERDFGKKQSSVYEPVEGAYNLGTKYISFRIKPHDPRKIEPFDKNWNANANEPGWVYDSAEMKEEMFRHRIGKLPLTSLLLESIPVLEESKIPDSGSVELNGDSYVPPWIMKADEQFAANETQSILLGSRNDRALLEVLHLFNIGQESGTYSNSYCDVLRGNIEASWDRKDEIGKLKISLFLSPNGILDSTRCKINRYSLNNAHFSLLLGLWCDILPFKLSELTHGLPTCVTDNITHKLNFLEDLQMFRKHLGGRPIENLNIDTMEKVEIDRYNKEAKPIWNKHTYQSSAGFYDAGGISDKDLSFSGTLKRYFSEHVLEQSDSMNITQKLLSLSCFGRTVIGFNSSHRSMRSKGSEIKYYTKCEGVGMRCFLSDEDHGILSFNLVSHARRIRKRVQTFGGILQQLENLGHEEVKGISGLNVELLDFQRQVVSWAIEREKAPLGLQSFLWSKLPIKVSRVNIRETSELSLYYSPILDSFLAREPNIVRGGIIAEEMGLGKTIISLAIILENPAPVEPQSGTAVMDFETKSRKRADHSCKWTTLDNVSEESRRERVIRGSIFSRATLVVCNVSLVGQWIDEAKSKLRDPGMVYSYHGAGRVRNPHVLAKNSIVVTTYATLASDATYHRKKGGHDYCAPCEQIRWWRIICDESHVLRYGNTNHFSALKQIMSENRWCVTGTPMNTSLNDIKFQLNFIGIEYVDKMFELFQKIMPTYFKEKRVCNANKMGNFFYLMRNVMIRHSVNQKNKISKRDLIFLPPRVDERISIRFTKNEKKAYRSLESEAVTIYKDLKLKAHGNVSKNYLKVFSALLPLRIACSGGYETINTSEINVIKSGDKLIESAQGRRCSICLENFDEPYSTRCKPNPHVFCRECIEGVLGANGQSSAPCPICRKDVQLHQLHQAFKLEDSNKNKISKKDMKLIPDILFKSKFQRLLQELKRVKEAEPHSHYNG
mmetsp:Transcript_10273/g.14525  ORF Transcript_10273/g.14525 Transcript_10273/m.14525 type:complete len:1332 (+) Transcript_10273:110-4105(+)